MDTVSIDSRSLYALLGSADAPCILDVRREAAYEAKDRLIPGALRAGPDPTAHAETHPRERPIVVYCVHGHEVSQDAASLLRSKGFDAVYLEGGIEAWSAAGLPTIRRRPDWRVPGGSRWITRERPKIDRIACPWLVRRFVDPEAEFLYVPTLEVKRVAQEKQAVPYDIPDVEFSHEGELCSFDAFLKCFHLKDPALDELAVIVRGADTGRPELAPQAPGLLSISLGLSLNFRNDHEMLEHGMVMYDALYSW